MSNYRTKYQQKGKTYSKEVSRKKDPKVSISFFKENMEKISYWAQYPIDDFATTKGDAYKIAEAFCKESGKDKSKNKSSQLRKFYDATLKVRNKIKTSIDDAKVQLMMVVPRVYYSHSRSLITDAVKDFITYSLDLKKFREDSLENFTADYNRFIQFFEALIGYHYFLKGD
ncbi:MAG: type III-A CRISPR-associated protein Csm2 [Candidatus Heimdallarchaeaceae archaeon]